MTAPNGYIPVESAAIHAAGLADQPMLYWREEWDAPQIMLWSGLGPYGNSLGWYARECKALREAMAEHRSELNRLMNNVAPSFGNHGQAFRDRHVNLYGEPVLGPLGLGPIR